MDRARDLELKEGGKITPCRCDHNRKKKCVRKRDNDGSRGLPPPLVHVCSPLGTLWCLKNQAVGNTCNSNERRVNEKLGTIHNELYCTAQVLLKIIDCGQYRRIIFDYIGFIQLVGRPMFMRHTVRQRRHSGVLLNVLFRPYYPP